MGFVSWINIAEAEGISHHTLIWVWTKGEPNKFQNKNLLSGNT